MATTCDCAQVIAKFEELHKKYYFENNDVYMVTTLPDSIAETFITSNPETIWEQKYNFRVSDKVPILCATVEVELLGRKFKVQFDRPFKREHRSEFEDHFGFGGHCSGYTDKRIIVCFPRTCRNEDMNVAELLTSADAIIDDEYVKRALALLVMGGYTKYWDAYYEFSAWFTSFGTFPGADVKAKDVILPYILDHMIPKL
jgi:hypothetical protein